MARKGGVVKVDTGMVKTMKNKSDKTNTQNTSGTDYTYISSAVLPHSQLLPPRYRTRLV